MKNKILFTHSYFYKFDSKQWENKQPYPPLGTITAAAWMRQNGFEISLCDTALASGPDIIDDYLAQNPNYVVIYDDGFNYLTKMCLTNMREAAWEMAKKAKKIGATVIVSSSDSTDHFEKYLNNGADFVILGEAEQTILELISTLNTNVTQFENIAGLAYKTGDGYFKTIKRQVQKNLDQFPMAAWDLIKMDDYKNIWIENWGYFSLNIATTRGCPFKCNWCAKPIYGNRYNSRSPQHVANEIEYLLKNFNPSHFWMCDDIFGLKPGWVQQFNNEVQSKNLKFSYKIQSRVDLLLQEDTIDALVKSGLETVWVGAESGSQKILDAMDKGTTVEQIEEATKILKTKNVKVGFFLQFGYLGETNDDITLTLKMIKKLKPDEIGISVSYPLPGTAFFEKVKTELKDKQNWTDSDDLAMMYNGTFHPKFYKKLHRYVHKVFRTEKAKESLIKLLSNPTRGNFKTLKVALSGAYYGPASYLNKLKLSRLAKLKN